MPAPFVETRDILKVFPGVTANDRISIRVDRGEIRALLGENGAGKTTLMSVIYGLLRPDFGQILLSGREISFRSPLEALASGIYMVQQRFSLIPSLTVTENVAIMPQFSKGMGLNLSSIEAKIREVCERTGLTVDTRAKVWQLPVGIQQRIEVLKALLSEARLLLLDEPTSVLTKPEADQFFESLRSMRDQGLAVLISTHKLAEVMQVSDTVTVLRDGKVVLDKITTEVNMRELALAMVGREFALEPTGPATVSPEPALELLEVSAMSDRRLHALNQVTLRVHRGEILGVAGVAGNGQTELAEVAAGLRKTIAGSIHILGKDATNRTPRFISELGVNYIPEAGYATGLNSEFTIWENLALKSYRYGPYSAGLLLKPDKMREDARQLISDFDIKTRSEETKAKFLSGGNKQKVVAARELSRRASLIIATNPTAGLDVKATNMLHQRLLAAKAQGTAVLLISDDLNEILQISDRVAVLFAGKIVGQFPTSQASVEKLGTLMAGRAQLEEAVVGSLS